MKRKNTGCKDCKYLSHGCWCTLLAKCVNPRYSIENCPRLSMDAMKKARREKRIREWRT